MPSDPHIPAFIVFVSCNITWILFFEVREVLYLLGSSLRKAEGCSSLDVLVSLARAQVPHGPVHVINHAFSQCGA